MRPAGDGSMLRMSTGVAEARIALNHNETVLDARP